MGRNQCLPLTGNVKVDNFRGKKAIKGLLYASCLRKQFD